MAKGEKRLVIWWAILVGLTLLSFESASGFAFLSDPAVSITLIIGIAMLKVRIVILNFMEVAHAPLVLRLPLETWVIAIGIAILGVWFAFGA
jgi:hypothetical protein